MEEQQIQTVTVEKKSAIGPSEVNRKPVVKTYGVYTRTGIRPRAVMEAIIRGKLQRMQFAIKDHQEVPGVTYRTSPTTGMKRPVKPKCIR